MVEDFHNISLEYMTSFTILWLQRTLETKSLVCRENGKTGISYSNGNVKYYNGKDK